MDCTGGRAFGHHSRNGGRGFVNKNSRNAGHLIKFFKWPGFARVFCPRGMLAVRIDSHITSKNTDGY